MHQTAHTSVLHRLWSLGREIFVQTSQYIFADNLYRFGYKKGHAENIFSFAAEMFSIAQPWKPYKTVALQRGIYGNHFQSSIQSVRRGGQCWASAYA